MLTGAIAYYALLSLVPLLILSVLTLSHLVDRSDLLIALGRYLEWPVPSQSKAVLTDLAEFLDNRIALGAALVLTMLFFSSLAFGILEKAMAVIFPHRGTIKKRHILVSVVLQTMAQESVHLLNRDWSLVGVSGLIFYVLGFAAEVLIVATLYLALPVGRMPLSHAVIGGLVVSAVCFAWKSLRLCCSLVRKSFPSTSDSNESVARCPPQWFAAGRLPPRVCHATVHHQRGAHHVVTRT